MDTSTNLLSEEILTQLPDYFTIQDLRRFDDSGELVKKAIAILEALVSKLKPKLKYLCTPVRLDANEKQHIRAILVFYVVPNALFLDEKGEFFSATPVRLMDAVNDRTYCQVQPKINDFPAFEFFHFDGIISSLNDFLAEAEARMRKHAAEISAVREKFDATLELLTR